MSKQGQISTALAQLNPGESIVIPGRGGWQLCVHKRDGGAFDFTHRNIDDRGGGFRFFAYETSGNPYGAGKIRQEPSLVTVSYQVLLSQEFQANEPVF